MAKQVKDIRVAVGEQLAKIAPRVETEVVEAIVDKGVEKRVNALISCLDKLETADKELSKLGPDDVKYDDKGAKTDEFFTKKRVDERAKAQGKINKLTNAINKALDKGDYSDVYNLAAGKDTPASDTEGNSEDNTAAS